MGLSKLPLKSLHLPHRLREVLHTRERPSKWDDMRELQAMWMIERGTWKNQLHDLLVDGVPVNVAGGLAGLEVNPLSANYPTVTAGGTELSLWTPQTHTPVNAQQMTPKVYQLSAFGTKTSAATPGTETLNPRVDVVGGSSMGISGAITPTASETASTFSLEGRLILRKGGDSAATMVGA